MRTEKEIRETLSLIEEALKDSSLLEIYIPSNKKHSLTVKMETLRWVLGENSLLRFPEIKSPYYDKR